MGGSHALAYGLEIKISFLYTIAGSSPPPPQTPMNETNHGTNDDNTLQKSRVSFRGCMGAWGRGGRGGRGEG